MRGRFVRSFVTFEHLPYRVRGGGDITPKGKGLIRQVPGPRRQSGERRGGDQRMTFDDGEDDAMLNMNDPFSNRWRWRTPRSCAPGTCA